MQESSQNLKYTIATQAIDRVTPSKDALSLCEKLSTGKISANDAVDAVKKKYGLIRGNTCA